MQHNNHQRFRGALAGIGLSALVLAAVVFALRRQTGSFMYPVDDAFIHMEVAKNFAQSGTWGINPGAFGSASSSLLYTVVLAFFFKLFSPSFLIPFVVNVLAGIGVCLAVSTWLSRQQLSLRSHLLIVLLAVVFTPVPIVVLSGMEHTLQCLFSFLLLFQAADWIAATRGGEGSKRLPWSLPVLALLTASIRYEGLFLVGMVGLALLIYRHWKAALLIGAAALLPIVLFGLWSVSKGSFFLPNSVLIKGNEVPLFSGGVGHLMETVLVEKLTLMKPGITALATQRLLLLLPLTWLLFHRQLKEHLAYSLILLILTGTALAHLTLASTGKFYRYEAYLVLCSSVIVPLVFLKFGRTLFPRRPHLTWLVGGVLLFFLCLPLLLRASAGFTKARQSCVNIFEQQHQMGRFLREYYPTTTVAANDIGAVSFYTSGKIVDLWGLG